MRIAWYDHGFYHQSAAIPDLPAPEETWGVYGDKAHLHSRVNVVGMETWRIPLLHRILDDGHELLWLTRRKVDPSPELDEDLARLVGQYPEYERFVRPVDPCLNPDKFQVWPVRTYLNQHYFDDQELFLNTTNPSTEMLRYWVREQVLGEVPDADIFVCAVMRADEATAFEVSYFTGVYLERGVPIVLWDQDHQLSGSVAMFKRLGHDWPNPLVTVIGPYEEPTSYADPICLDYPYVDLYEREPLPMEERIGGVYVGNDYGRREAMERLLLHLPDEGVPVTVWGRYEAKDGPQWTARFPKVNWAGRIPTNQVPGTLAKGHFTVNMVKADYMPIGLLTLRTFESNVMGTLQLADARIKRIHRYVPQPFLLDNKADAARKAKRIMELSDDEYREHLEVQRALTRRNNMDAFTTRFYEILDRAMGGRKPRRDLPTMSTIPPPMQLRPGMLCQKDDERVPLGEYAGVGWSPEWKERKERAMAAAALEDDNDDE